MSVKRKELLWLELQEILRNTDNEKLLEKLIKEELAGKNRAQWKLRIHQRLSKLRREREANELLNK